LGSAGNRAALGTIIGLAICTGGSTAFGQEWKLESSLSQRVLYSDNLLLSRDREIETVGFITTPALLISRNSPTSQIALDARFEFAEYIDHSDFNSQDQLLGLQIDQALSERAAFRLSGAFTHDTTIKSEQDVTGRFLDDSIEFISWNVAPGFAYQVSPVDQAVLRANYRQTTYYDTDEKTDYEYFGPAFDWRHQLNELEAVTATVGATRFIPDEPGEDYTDTISTLFGYSYQSSERFSISGGVGVAYSMRHEDPGQDSDDLGFRLKFDMKYDLSDQTSVRASLSHDNEPSGDGDQVVRNRLVLGMNHRLTPLTTARLNIDYTDNVDIIGSEGDETSDEGTSRYTSVRPAVAWQLTEDWSLEAEYRFRYRLFDDDGGDAMSNSVFLTLQYDLPTWAGTGF
jgi:opacity protein-like surface antigen